MANQGIPPGGKYPSRGDLANLLKNFLGDTSTLNVDRRTLYGKQAGRIFNDTVNGKDAEDGFMGAGTYYNPQSYGVSQTATDDDLDAAGGDAPAFVEWDVPTSSTDYQRPRTVAAGYDASRQTMTVVFRDGTFYNYYEVTPGEWSSFSASFSKGRPWLNRKNKSQAADGLFINKPRGDAGDMSDMDPQIREALYRVARTTQQKRKPRKGRTSQTVYRTRPSSANFYGLEDSPRGRKRSTMQVPNRVKSEIKATRGGVNPNANAGKNRKAS
jgi:hypothetical protein